MIMEMIPVRGIVRRREISPEGRVVRTLRKFPHLPPVTEDFTWVPRSAALTNLINHPQIPAGFTEVPAD
jgi:hypothetical protein